MASIDLSSVLATSPLGLVFDLDGTLALMPPLLTGAQLWPGVTEDLERAGQYAHVAILTGRAACDAAQIVNVAGLTYIGIHGLEWCNGLPPTQSVELLAEARAYAEPGKQLFALLEQHLAELPGVLLQPKSVGGSAIYHLASDVEQTRIRLLALLEEPARRFGMRLGENRRIIEILAPLAINKGEALRRYVQRFQLQAVLFAGDDRTDLDAVLEIERLRQEGVAARSIVVQHAHSLPAMLAHADVLVSDVAGMAEQLHIIATFLEKQASHANMHLLF